MWLLIALAACGPEDQLPASDADDDGVVNRDDCAPFDPAVFPGAKEACNGRDDDCDVMVDEDLPIPPGLYVDADGDGFGGDALAQCDASAAVDVGGDCDDDNADAHPNGTERCGGGDEDCDGLVDSADPDAQSAGAGATKRYPDADGDSFGFGPSTWTCDATWGADNFDDCNDDDPAVHPAAIEVCDALDADEDCDGLTEDRDPSVETGGSLWWADTDADGFGDPSVSEAGCEPPDEFGWAANPDDCDDTRDSIHPESVEFCDGADDDCDGLVDEADPDLELSSQSTFGPDVDGDGFGTDAGAVDACVAPPGTVLLDLGLDCDDDAGDVFPGAVDLCDDGVDQDCFEGDLPCPFLGDETMEDPDLLVASTVLDARVGTAADAAGDVDGDGLDDFWVSAPGYGSSGRIALFTGGGYGTRSISSPDAWVDAQLGIGEHYEFGAALRGNLDFNGDGATDLLASAPFHPDDTLAEGQAYVFFGPFTGGIVPAEDVASRKWRADTGAYLGTALDAADIDGNGKVDVALAATGDTTYTVFVDTTTGVAGDVIETAEFRVMGLPANDFGQTLLLAPLADDGTHLLAVGAPCDDACKGWVGIFDPATPASLSWLDALTTADGESPGGAFGAALGAPGDVFGDGSEPLLVAENIGVTYLYTGVEASFDSDEYVTRIDETFPAAAQHSIGDLDGDGHVDLAIGGSSVEVRVWFGPIDAGVLLPESADAEIQDVVSVQHPVVGVGDANDDGADDLLIGDWLFGDYTLEGRAGLFYGGME